MSYPKGRPWPALTTHMTTGFKIKEAQELP
uniref:Uncharacterized protein n=1 Tax=viral metagenome TaxID=1070528 RepID=A0A6C0BBU0_9ZZZZ